MDTMFEGKQKEEIFNYVVWFMLKWKWHILIHIWLVCCCFEYYSIIACGLTDLNTWQVWPLKFLFRNDRVKHCYQLSSWQVFLFPLALPTDPPSCFTVSNKQWETPWAYFVHNRCPNGAFMGFVVLKVFVVLFVAGDACKNRNAWEGVAIFFFFFALKDEPLTSLDFLSCSAFF